MNSSYPCRSFTNSTNVSISKLSLTFAFLIQTQGMLKLVVPSLASQTILTLEMTKLPITLFPSRKYLTFVYLDLTYSFSIGWRSPDLLMRLARSCIFL